MADPKPSLMVRLFAEHRGALQAFFRRGIRSKANAQHLAQEVYLRMLRVSGQAATRGSGVLKRAKGRKIPRETLIYLHHLLQNRSGGTAPIKQQTLSGFEKIGKTTRRAQFLSDMDRTIVWTELATVSAAGFVRSDPYVLVSFSELP